MSHIKEPKMVEPCLVLVTMKDREYTAHACGFNFEEGVAEKVIDMKQHGRDRGALQNVMMLFPGTSYKILKALDPEGKDVSTSSETAKTPEDEGSKEKDGEGQEKTYTIADIKGMKKPELLELCKELGLEHESDVVVAELKELLVKELELEESEDNPEE